MYKKYIYGIGDGFVKKHLLVQTKYRIKQMQRLCLQFREMKTCVTNMILLLRILRGWFNLGQ